VTTFNEAQRDYLRASKAATRANERAANLRAVRDALCPHADVEEKTFYFEGSYLDTAYTEYWNRCMCCGKESERARVDHSWHG
jgi:hypothetical protein